MYILAARTHCRQPCQQASQGRVCAIPASHNEQSECERCTPASIERPVPGVLFGVARSLVLSQHLPKSLLGHIMLAFHLLFSGCLAVPAPCKPLRPQDTCQLDVYTQMAKQSMEHGCQSACQLHGAAGSTGDLWCEVTKGACKVAAMVCSSSCRD